MIKWDNSFLSSQSDFVFLKSTLPLITEQAFDLALSNRQVGCRHTTFCFLRWLIRELEACGRIPLLDLRLLFGVRWVGAVRQITLIPEMHMIYVPNQDTRICSACNCETWSTDCSTNGIKKALIHHCIGAVWMWFRANSQNPLQLPRVPPAKMCREEKG